MLIMEPTHAKLVRFKIVEVNANHQHTGILSIIITEMLKPIMYHACVLLSYNNYVRLNNKYIIGV